MGKDYDYVIVGAGSAGAVMAYRLSADPKVSVCLMEAGGPDRSAFIHMPFGLAILSRLQRINWNYETEPQPELEGRRLFWPRGKVLGGSSSINAMCYIRGAPENYDEWDVLGARGWNWENVKPYFLEAEDNSRGRSTHHATGGPLPVSDLRSVSGLSHAFVKAGTEVQLPENDDFNGDSQEGVGLYQVTQKNGARASTAVAYLQPAFDRPNLSILTNALVERILMDGHRASGVSVRVGKKRSLVEARRGVVLCGGTINSPQLLMLSGIGPAGHLADHGIGCVMDLPGVGENLQDHLDVIVQTRARSREGYGMALSAIPKTIASLFEYRRSGSGPLTSNIAEAGGFVRSGLAGKLPDIQWHFLPVRIEDHGRKTVFGYGYSLHACNLYPESRGLIRLKSADAGDPPAIDPRYLSRERDLEVMLDAVDWSRRILAAPAFDEHRGVEIDPGVQVDDRAGKEAFIRRRAETVYHPVGTCRMGAVDDDTAVVDPHLKVRGVEKLHVVDASVMPRLIGGNTNAPVIMIAERASEMILDQ